VGAPNILQLTGPKGPRLQRPQVGIGAYRETGQVEFVQAHAQLSPQCVRIATELLSIIGQILLGRSKQHAASEPEPGESSQEKSEKRKAQPELSPMDNCHEQAIQKE